MIDARLRRAVHLGLGALLLLFALLKVYSLYFVDGDEHMYFAMSLMVSRGKWPYRDFFFSHPPLQLYLMAGLYKVFGYSLILSKIVPSACAMVSGVHVFRLGRRMLGPFEALLAVFLFLFTFDVLRGSSHFTGANLALAFLLAGVVQVVDRRPVRAALYFGAGTFVGVYVAPMALMLIVLCALRSRREALTLLGVYAAVAAAVCGLFALACGPAFFYQVFTYNIFKVAMPYSWFAKLRNVFYLNETVMIGFLPAVFWAAAMWSTKGRTPATAPAQGFLAWVDPWRGDRVGAQILFTTFVLGYCAFYASRPDYYSYYFMLIMPWTALATAHVTVDVVRHVLARMRKPAPKAWRAWPLLGCAVVTAAVLAYRAGIEADRLEDGGDVRTYLWQDSPYLGGLNTVVHDLFWSPVENPRRLPGAITRYLQHETIHATRLDELARRLRAECRPGERIFGGYSLGPWASAVASCVLAASLADTNPHRFKVHESTPEEWIKALEADHLAIAITVDDAPMMREPALRAYFTRTFPRIVYTLDDPHLGHVELRRR